jgi:hypothetical protein
VSPTVLRCLSCPRGAPPRCRSLCHAFRFSAQGFHQPPRIYDAFNSLIENGHIDALFTNIAPSGDVQDWGGIFLPILALGEALIERGGLLLATWAGVLAQGPDRFFSPERVDGSADCDDPAWAELWDFLLSWTWVDTDRANVAEPGIRPRSITLFVHDKRAKPLVKLIRLLAPGHYFNVITINRYTADTWARIICHIDKSNVGPSILCLLGDFQGGATQWIDGTVLRNTNTMVHSNGHIPHWTSPTTGGERFSVIAYNLAGGPGGFPPDSVLKTERDRRAAQATVGSVAGTWRHVWCHWTDRTQAVVRPLLDGALFGSAALVGDPPTLGDPVDSSAKSCAAAVKHAVELVLLQQFVSQYFAGSGPGGWRHGGLVRRVTSWSRASASGGERISRC